MGQGWEASECMLRCPGFTFYLQKKREDQSSDDTFTQEKSHHLPLPQIGSFDCSSFSYPKSTMVYRYHMENPGTKQFTSFKLDAILSKVAELLCPLFHPAGVGIVLLSHGYVLYALPAQWSLGSQHGIPSVSGLQYLCASHLRFASAQSQSMRAAMPATSICQGESVEYRLSDKVKVFDSRKGIIP